MVMLDAGSLNRNHMILHEEGSTQRTTNAVVLLSKLHPNSEEERAYLGCLIGSMHTGQMGVAVKEYLKGALRAIALA